MTWTRSAPLTPLSALYDRMREQGFAVLSAADVAELAGCRPEELEALRGSWDDLPPDAWLRDGGRYRQRRHACFVSEDGVPTRTAHRAHWQPVVYNALHGGMQRWFEPIAPETVALPVWGRLLGALADVCSVLSPQPRWYIEAHQFRIDTTDGIGRPTPEGAHRDGVDFVAVMLVGRSGIKGGETRVFEADGPHGQRFTLDEPWSLLLLDDARVIHETTPIQPIGDAAGRRDTLVLTFRGRGFLGG